MKTRKIWAFLLTAFLIVITLAASAQEMSRQDYLDKSKRQKTAGFVTLGGGLVLGIIGASNYDDGSNFNIIAPTVPKQKDPSNAMWSTLMITGGLAMIGSIPMFISSSKNKKKAAQLSFNPLPTNIPRYVGNMPRHVPSLTLTLPL
jgi:uncharacterized membrane protein